VPTVLGLWSKAANFADVVPAVYQPWYPRWSDAMNVELTACLSGKIKQAGADGMMRWGLGEAR